MKEEVTKVAKMLNAILNQQGFEYKKNAVLQTLEDFESSTMREIQRDFDNDDYDDIEDMTKNVNVYIDLKNLINENSNDKAEFQNAYNKIINTYEYYEQKYIRELEFRNSEQRKNYIETIMSPLILISLYFEEEKNKI
ncbi:hypothetical protein VT569_05225 [Flavobacterium psychrophilum]|jgi:hypothetical protein|uniref:hypothetical protein n=1 Tax=Flavobacterium psychrophilum TaxID=96345 RepID=UPI003B42F079